MKWIVDAQLPYALSRWLNEKGYDAIHTMDLPKKNKSGDNEIATLADIEDRIIISKDSDFWDDHHIKGSPRKLLIVKTGNIRNSELLHIFDENLNTLLNIFKEAVLVEMSANQLIVHH